MRKLFFDEIRSTQFNKKVEAKQDRFAYGLGGTNGTYIEIGAYKPEHKNNSFSLEMLHGWKGFSLEFNEKLKAHWDQCDRKNKIYWADAMTFDYLAALKENNMPTRINYLQVDIEPPENTFTALQRVIEKGIICDGITFEHDKYRNDVDYDVIATEFLKEHGYKVAVKNVLTRKKDNPTVMLNFETWFVKDDIDFETMEWTDWMEKYVSVQTQD
jgi:hypothetical protein